LRGLPLGAHGFTRAQTLGSLGFSSYGRKAEGKNKGENKKHFFHGDFLLKNCVDERIIN
jgi:hypothetical protein